MIRYLGMEPEVSKDKFSDARQEELTGMLYQTAMQFYKRKQQAMVQKVLPLIKDLHANRGETLENVVVPFTDGRKGSEHRVNLQRLLKLMVAK